MYNSSITYISYPWLQCYYLDSLIALFALNILEKSNDPVPSRYESPYYTQSGGGRYSKKGVAGLYERLRRLE